MSVNNPLENATDHVIWEYLKLQDDAAWKLAWERAVLAEAGSYRNGAKARDWGVSAEELMSMLYLDMVGAHKLALYRDDGGSLWGWMRAYVRGYINRARPDERIKSFNERAACEDGDDNRTFEEKISKFVSDFRGHNALTQEDPALRRREQWELVQKCFADLYKKNPTRAYVHLLKLRMNLSSTEIKNMLGMSSEANVDQAFSRAIKDMRSLKVQHEECE